MPELLNRNPLVAVGFLGALLLGMLLGGQRQKSSIPLPKAKEFMISIPRVMILKGDDPEYLPGLPVNLVRIVKGVVVCSVTSKPLSLFDHQRQKMILGPIPSLEALEIIMTRQRGYKFIPAKHASPSCNDRTEIVYGHT